MRSFIFAGAALALLSLSACGGVQSEARYPTGAERSQPDQNAIYEDAPSIFGEGGLFGGQRRADEGAGATGIGVNAFLWRASLETISFMPLASADPFGGVILTDWYSPPENANERFKINVFILDRQLRSDGVQVTLFRQTLRNGQWRDATPSAGTARELEDAILTRARQMRVAQMGGRG